MISWLRKFVVEYPDSGAKKLSSFQCQCHCTVVWINFVACCVARYLATSWSLLHFSGNTNWKTASSINFIEMVGIGYHKIELAASWAGELLVHSATSRPEVELRWKRVGYSTECGCITGSQHWAVHQQSIFNGVFGKSY